MAAVPDHTVPGPMPPPEKKMNQTAIGYHRGDDYQYRDVGMLAAFPPHPAG